MITCCSTETPYFQVREFCINMLLFLIYNSPIEVPEREVENENSDWSSASLFSLSKTLSGLYCLILISIYISGTIQAMVFNSDWLDGDVSRRELGDNDALHITQIEVEMGRMQNKKFIDFYFFFTFIQEEIFHMYLYLGSCVILLCLICCMTRSETTYVNVKSHGNAFVRIGAIFFGVGSFFYYALEFVSYAIIDLDPHCVNIPQTANSIISILFIIFQVESFGCCVLYGK